MLTNKVFIWISEGLISLSLFSLCCSYAVEETSVFSATQRHLDTHGHKEQLGKNPCKNFFCLSAIFFFLAIF